MLFVDYMIDWLADQRRYLELTTYEGYYYVVNSHIVPYFCDTDFELDVHPYELQKYFNFKFDSGLSANTLRKHKAILHKAFNDAIFNCLTDFNPCDRVRIPKVKKYRSNIYNLDELKQLLSLVQGHYIEVPVTLAVYFGFRRGEVLGLRWSDVDFAGRTISVSHTITAVCTIVDKPPKNDSSYRVMPLNDTMYDYLLRVKGRQALDLDYYGKDYYQSDYVCRHDNGKLITPDALSAAFKRFIDRYNLRPIRYHDLRHSNISLLLNSGMSLKHISQWAGHSSINITADTYAHLDTSSKQIMSSKIDDLLKI